MLLTGVGDALELLSVDPAEGSASPALSAVRRDYAASPSPSFGALGDIDGDGNVDLVTFNGFNVSVMPGAGDGNFGPKIEHTSNARPDVPIELVDVERDGDLDILLMRTNGGDIRPTLMLNNGDGSFVVNGSTSLGYATTFPAMADVNHDGRLDLIAPNPHPGNTVSVQLGNGDGSFAPRTTYDVDYCPLDVALGDVDRDGDLDIVAARENNLVSLLLGYGDGTFEYRGEYKVGYRNAAVKVALGDLDQDGALDVVTANVDHFGNDYISVLPGYGNGTFAPRVEYVVGDAPYSMELLDLDGDGDLDVVTANQDSDSVSVLLGSGDGTFVDRSHYAVGASPASLHVNDIDGDRILDLVTRNSSGASVSVLVGNGDGTFADQVEFALPGNASSLAIEDVDIDGDLDIAATIRESDIVSVLLIDAANGSENHPPVWDSIGDQTVDEGTQRQFTVRATDPDGDGVRYGLGSDSPEWISIDPITGTIVATPAEEDGPGTYPITVHATDDHEPVKTASETFIITVNEVNQPPVLGDVADQQATVGEPLTFEVTASDPDFPQNNLVFGLDGGFPAGVSISPDGVFSWTPTEDQRGEHEITVRVTDDGTPNLTDAETFTITVGSPADTGQIHVDYSTYLGGIEVEDGLAVAIDHRGFAYVAGLTASPGLATPNAYDTTHNGDDDAFVAKYDLATGDLVYFTYLGGSANDVASAMAVDVKGVVSLTGSTSSSDFPTLNAFQPSFGGGVDGFVLKLDTNAGTSGLVYSSYLGGSTPAHVSANDEGSSVVLDASGNAWIAGYTGSDDFPTTPDAFQPGSGSSGNPDAFLTKVSPTGRLLYATYFGGNRQDFGQVQLDTSGNVYLLGYTTSASGLPITNDAVQKTHGGGFDGFLAKFDATGRQLLHSSYLGGSGDDFLYDLAVDASGTVYVVGDTSSTDFQTTSNAFQPTYHGDATSHGEGIVVKLNPTLSAIEYSTFFGGSGEFDSVYTIEIDGHGSAYLAGPTQSPDFPIRDPLPGQGTLRGGKDGFVARLDTRSSTPPESQLIFSTFVGGSKGDQIRSLVRDSQGKIYVTGHTGSGDFPVTADAHQPVYGGGSLDAFLVILSESENGNHPPVVANDSYTTDEDTPLDVAAAGVLTNDRDVDGDPLTAVLVSGPTNGSLTLNASGSFTYMPNANFHGADTFTYKANDGAADSNVATVNIGVMEVNDPPVANDDSASTGENAPITIMVLDNDTDVDSAIDQSSVQIDTPPTRGTASVDSERGEITYRPNPDFSGSDHFTYTVRDEQGAISNPARVTVTVTPAENQAPVAADDEATTPEDSAVTIDVLENDSDPDGDPLAVIFRDEDRRPEHGQVAVNPNGTITYVPDEDFHGADQFEYTISDGRGGSDTALVAVEVVPVNDAPVAEDDRYEMRQGDALIIFAPGVLSNDGDVDGDPLSAVLEDGPTNGELELNSDGSFTYTPHAGFYGEDSFTYKAQDPGLLESNVATVGISVTQSPFGEIRGQKFNDLDRDGQHDSGEPGLNGWQIQLLDEHGNLRRTAETGDIDLNGDGTIDPETERGLYHFTDVEPGRYVVVEVMQPGWEQTLPGRNRVLSADVSDDHIVSPHALAGVEKLILAGDPNGTPADSPNQRVDPNTTASDWAGVGSLNVDDRFLCTATAISPRHVLTAGHCLDANDDGSVDFAPSDIVFNLNYGTDLSHSIVADDLAVHPDFTGFGQPSLNDDVAVITLDEELPTGVPVYELYRQPVFADESLTLVGYGTTGDGVNGFQSGTATFSTKRVGKNAADWFFLDDETDRHAEVVVWDFDGPVAAFGNGPAGGPTLGNDIETQLGPGDSGGPGLVRDDGNWKIAAINTFGGEFKGWPAPNGRFTSAGGGMVVPAYTEWIDSIIGEDGQLGSYTIIVEPGAIVDDIDFGNARMAETQVRIHLEATDAEGNPVSSVPVGAEFSLDVYVEDVRDEPNGVFAAYLDVIYAAELVSVDGPVVFGSHYANGQSADVSVPGILDEVGAFDGLEYLGDGEYLLASIPFEAYAPGPVVFMCDPADEIPGHEVLVYGDNSAVPTLEIDYGSVSIEISHDEHDVNGDGTVSPIDVLLMINELNGKGSRTLPSSNEAPFLDVNGDGSLSPLDVLQVINYLNNRTAGEGEPSEDGVDRVLNDLIDDGYGGFTGEAVAPSTLLSSLTGSGIRTILPVRELSHFHDEAVADDSSRASRRTATTVAGSHEGRLDVAAQKDDCEVIWRRTICPNINSVIVAIEPSDLETVLSCIVEDIINTNPFPDDLARR